MGWLGGRACRESNGISVDGTQKLFRFHTTGTIRGRTRRWASSVSFKQMITKWIPNQVQELDLQHLHCRLVVREQT